MPSSALAYCFVIEAAPAAEIRGAWPQDQAFVGATFAEQLGRGGHKNPNAIVDRILDSDRVRILIASRGRRIVGWLAYADIPRVRALLFAYVRKDDRHAGIATQLADAAWPQRKGQWVHAGLRGTGSAVIDGARLRDHWLTKHAAVEMPLEDLI